MQVKPMNTIKEALVLAGLHPVDKNASDAKKIISILGFVVIMSFQLEGISFSLAFWIKYWKVDLEKSLYTIVQIAATSCIIYPLIVAFFLRPKVASMFVNLTKIYHAYENDDEAFTILMQVNNKTDWAWKMWVKYALTYLPISMAGFAALSIALGMLVVGHLDTAELYHPYVLRMPWNQKTLLGYIAEIAHSIATTECYFYANGLFILMLLGFSLHHQGFFRVFKRLLRKLKYSNEYQNDHATLSQVIEFHNCVKLWFEETSEYFSPIVLFQLICNMLLLTASVFQFDLQLKHIGHEFTILIVSMMNGTTNLFIYNYFGMIATESYRSMADALYDIDWTNLDVKLQKYLIIMIGNAQIPIHYHGFKIAVLNLETFMSFINTTVSYYMLLKTLTETG